MTSYSDWAAGSNTGNISWLSEFSDAQSEQFLTLGFPTKKTEHFRFNNLDCLNQIDWDATSSTEFDLGECILPNSTRVVFVDGKLDKVNTTCEQFTSLEDASAVLQKKLIEKLNYSDFSRNNFASAICANLAEGIFVNASELDAPLEIIHVQTRQHKNTTALVFELGKNDEAIVLERFINHSDETLYQTHTVVDIEDNARFTHYRLNTETSMHLGQVEYLLSSESRLDAFHLGFGSKIKRVDINIHHRSSGSHAQLDGIYYANGTQQVDYHTTIEHTTAHCESDEVFRGILDGQAVGVFNGRIHIHRDAQKVRAELSNKNLLLNLGARIHTKPELEIYADDVICGHGATISRPNNEELFYLLARGIPRKQAELMLTFAFINELIDNITHEEVSEYCRPLLEAKLTGGII